MIDNKLLIHLALTDKNNYLYYDLAGSGKSKNTIEQINLLNQDGIIIWCGYSLQDLYEKQKYLKKKSIVINTDNKDSDSYNKCKDKIADITDDIEVVLMPLQYYRKFNPAERINKIKPIQKVIIDELSYLDILVPSLFDENYIYNSSIENTIKQTFCKEDLLNQKEKMKNNDKTPSWAFFISKSKFSHIVLSTELLTRVCLDAIGYKTISGDENAQKHCKLLLMPHKNCSRDFISYMDMKDGWNKIGFEIVFCNASNGDNIINHTVARGSNKYIGKKCLSVFRRFGNVPEFSMKTQLHKILPHYDEEELMKIYYTDCLNQVVSRTLGYRGEEIGYAICHPNCIEVINKDIFPYQIIEVEHINDELTKELNECKKIDTSWFDKLVFNEKERITVKELKEISGMPATKAVKILNDNGYSVKIKKIDINTYVYGLSTIKETK